MAKYPNRVVTNRRSPSNEAALNNIYRQLVPQANRKDGYDISAVVAKDGTKGHALVLESANRSKDRDKHIGKNFVPDSELKKRMKK